MNQLKKLFNSPNLGSLLFRLFVGLSIALAHGFGKTPPSQQLIDGVTAMGFPLPLAFAWAASLSEFAGGLLIAAGFFTRYAALFLGITMGVAAFMVHAADPFKTKETALLYLFACIILLLQGAGKFSLDRLFRKAS